MKLTKRTVDGLEPRAKRYIEWDDELPRFGLRVETSGAKVFLVDYHTVAGRRRRLTVGRYGVLTCEEARARAKRLLSQVSEGADPLKTKQEAREQLTLREFSREYLDYARAHKKPRTVATDESLLDRLILPRLGSHKLSGVRREDVARWHRSHQDHAVQANRALATLSHIFTMAASWGYVSDDHNPCRHVARFREARRERFLSTEELGRLGQALQGLLEEYPHNVLAIRLLLLTGCRLNEILTLRWADVDLEHEVIHLRDAKAGPRKVPLGMAAAAVLQPTPRLSEWVVPGGVPGGHLVNLNKFWRKKVLPAAGLESVRLHDLRHTTGAVGASAGLSMPIIAKVLGHRQVGTTERYAHLANSPVHEAADRISSDIAVAMGMQEAGEVVELKR